MTRLGILLTLALSLVGAGTCGAADRPGPVIVTLEHAVRSALSANPGFSAERQAVGIARGRYREARGVLLPQLRLSAANTRQSKPDVSSPLGGAFGGSLFADEVNSKRVALSQVLFDRRARASAASLKKLADASREDVRKARIDLVAEVKTAFYDLLLSRELVAVSRASVDQVERQLVQARQNVAAGLAADLEQLRAEVQLANVRPELIRAESSAEVARETLANLMGLDASTSIEAKGEFLRSVALPERDELVARARKHRPDLAAARRRESAAREAVESARGGRWPGVNLIAAHDRSEGQRFPLDQEIGISSVSVSVDVPLFDGNISAGRVQSAHAELERAREQGRALEQEIDLDVTRTLSRLAEAQSLLRATETAEKQAVRALEIAEEGYSLGTRTYLELLDAQLALAVSRRNRAQALRDCSVAQVELDRACGDTALIDGKGPAQKGPYPTEEEP